MTEPYRPGQRVVDLGFAQLDTDRVARTGDPEVVNGSGKTAQQVVGALRALHRAHPERAVLATRLSDEALAACRAELPGAEVDDLARVAVLGQPLPTRGRVAVVGAGTADLPVVRECAVTVRVFGAEPDVIVDVGVAGLHRLLARRERIDDRRRGCGGRWAWRPRYRRCWAVSPGCRSSPCRPAWATAGTSMG